MQKQKKVGFLGGTFDPFHLGHLNLAIEVLEKTDINEIWICPTNISPFKTKAPPIDISHRIKMIQEAISSIKNISLIDIEARQTAPSYTYNTLESLCVSHKLRPEQLTLILSDDLLTDLHQWHRIEDLVHKYPIIVGSRQSAVHFADVQNTAIYTRIKNSFLQIRQMEISSSEIRQRLKNKLCCAHLLPLKTLDYIYNYKLYY